MKALVLHGPGSYAFEPEWPMPTVPAGWSLVQVSYCGICGSDLPRFDYAGSYRHPMILGHEFSGTVVKPAENSCFQTGDPVAVLPIIPCGHCSNCARGFGAFHCEQYAFIGSRNDGGFAQYCAVPESNLLRLPSCDALKQGALIEPMAVALHAVRRSGFCAGKSVIVFGSGPIGMLIGMWLKNFGARRVVMADVRGVNLEIAQSAGLENTFDPKSGCPNETFDFAFEAAGSGIALRNAIDWLAHGTKLTVVGRDVHDTTIPKDCFENLMRKEITLNGCWGYDMRNEEPYLQHVFEQGIFMLEPLITREISLEEAPETISAMCAKSFPYCKVLVRMN